MHSCSHTANLFSNSYGKEIYQSILNAATFPLSNKNITFKASRVCHYCSTSHNQSKRVIRPRILLACVHCIHFSCWTHRHIHQHLRENTGHYLSVCVDRGNLYCSACQDFVYEQNAESTLQSVREQHMEQIGLSNNHWRPTFNQLKHIKYIESVPLSPTKSYSRPTRGLINMGNTCFLNVVIQALTHTPALRDFLLTDDHRCCTDQQSRTCLACEMIRVTQEIYRPDLNPFVPNNLLYSIWLHAKHLAGYEQRDAHEFLIALLSLIHSHLKGEKHLPPIANRRRAPCQRHSPSLSSNSSSSSSTPSSSSLSCKTTNSDLVIPSTIARSISEGQSSCSRLTTANHLIDLHNGTAVATLEDENSNSAVSSISSTSSSSGAATSATTLQEDACSVDSVVADKRPAPCNCIVHQVFFGDLESVISYDGCMHSSATIQPFLDLPLDVVQSESTSLQACLSSYFRAESIDGLLNCAECNMRRPAIKKFSLLHLPNVLCFYLKRVDHDSKLSTSITFPADLDLAPFMNQFTMDHSSWSDRYSLYAVLTHSGQSDSGHYTACIRATPGSWCLCDDQKIVPVSLDHVLNTSAYVLLYHKNTLAVHS